MQLPAAFDLLALLLLAHSASNMITTASTFRPPLWTRSVALFCGPLLH
jgi:hypothetical protein